jgi:hypothetical protein
MLAGGGLADAQLAGDQNAADAVFDQVAIDLSGEMLPGMLEPLQDLEAAFVRQGAQYKLTSHIDN